ncbi:immunoglobulin-like domain-containing protein [Vibrio sp. ED004]|uniref:immunoglobulin-like domain-containing protein n=1 Tax=Vibrio sp. ED004 TaxID=2785124 RepID=UPI0032B73751
MKDPTAATTTINDDSDVTTVSLSADASVTEGENITYTATLTNPADGAGDGHAKQWCNDHYR